MVQKNDGRTLYFQYHQNKKKHTNNMPLITHPAYFSSPHTGGVFDIPSVSRNDGEGMRSRMNSFTGKSEMFDIGATETKTAEAPEVSTQYMKSYPDKQ